MSHLKGSGLPGPFFDLVRRNMVYTVTCNPSIDYIVGVDDFALGKTNRTASESMVPGGKGINVSFMLSNLGVDTTAVYFTAGFTGKEITRLIRERGIPTKEISCPEGCSRINIKFTHPEGTEINGRGPVIDETSLAKLSEILGSVQSGDVVVLSGSIAPGMPDTIYADILKDLAGKGILSVVDATKDVLMKTLPYHPFLIKPNKAELEEIFGVPISSKDEALEYAAKLHETGARNVLVSLGKDGAVMVTENGERYRADAPKGEVINAVGAGDAMVAGFLSAYLNGIHTKEAFYYGVITGSASAFAASFPMKEEVEALMKKGDFHEGMESEIRI